MRRVRPRIRIAPRAPAGRARPRKRSPEIRVWTGRSSRSGPRVPRPTSDRSGVQHFLCASRLRQRPTRGSGEASLHQSRAAEPESQRPRHRSRSVCRRQAGSAGRPQPSATASDSRIRLTRRSPSLAMTAVAWASIVTSRPRLVSNGEGASTGAGSTTSATGAAGLMKTSVSRTTEAPRAAAAWAIDTTSGAHTAARRTRRGHLGG